MKLYLDDIRPAPQGWRLVTDVQTANAMLRNFQIDEISLDHDLGTEATGMAVLDLIETLSHNNDSYVPPYIKIHTMNGSVRGVMQTVANRLNKLRSERLPKS